MKKGFSLVEILAVIILLGVIMLITTPIVLNVVGDSRKKAFETTAHGLAKAAENECLEQIVLGNKQTMEVTFSEGEVISEDKLAFSGRGPREGKIVVDTNCKVRMAITDGEWCVQKGFNTKEIINIKLSELEDGECEVTDFAGLIEWQLQDDGKVTAILPIVIGGEVEYSIDGINWQSSNVFENLEPCTNYTFRVRIDGVEIDQVITIVTPCAYTITYIVDAGGSIYPTSRYVLEEGIALGPEVTVDPGYGFVNFTIEDGFGRGVLNDTNGLVTDVSGDMTIKANFVINHYTINYQSNQGATFTPNYRTVVHGSSSTTPSIAVDPGYTFSHYIVFDGVGNGSLNTTTGNVTNVVGNMTIEATFVMIQYVVSYTASSGGTITPSSREVLHGENAEAPNANPITGYSFSNYSVTSGAGNGTLNTSTGVVSNVIGPMTIGANFTLNQYLVSYDADGGTCTPTSRTVDYGTSAAGPSCSRSGYNLTGFTIASGSCAGTFTPSNGTCSNVQANMTIRANWVIGTYTVTYNANGGSCSPTSRTVNHGGSAAGPSCSRTGYTLSSFSVTSGACAGTFSASTGTCSNVQANMTISANWTINTYTVTYNANGGSCSPTSRTINYGSSAAGPSCSRTGYTLTGFTITDGSCAGTFTASTGACSNVQANMTIRANWSVASYTVTYNANGGSCSPTSRTVNHGGSAAGPSCSRTGYTLSNFSVTSGSCAGTFTASTGACSNVQTNITIRANWTINTYTVSYNANGGSCSPTSRTVNYGSSAAGPSCSRTGYTLSNFSITSGGCAGTFTASTGACSNVQQGMTIRANWTAIASGSLSCYSVTASSITVYYSFSNGSNVSLFSGGGLVTTFGSGSSSGYYTMYTYPGSTYYLYLRNGTSSSSTLLASTTCTTPVANNTLTVQSSPSGITMTDYYGTGLGGTTTYTRSSSSTMNTWLIAPSNYGSYQFSYWSGCYSTSGNYCQVYVDGGGSLSPVAYYTYYTPPAQCSGSLSFISSTRYSAQIYYSYSNCSNGTWLRTSNYAYGTNIYTTPGSSGYTTIGWEPYNGSYSLSPGTCYTFTLHDGTFSGPIIASTSGCTRP